jgi:cation transport regulator
MPYTTQRDLPDAVKALPAHARKIWMRAFNAASKQYDKEEQAFRVAWSAIQKAGYHKKGERWVRMKEADGDDDELSALEQAWIDGAVAAMLPDAEASDPLTEQAYPDDPRQQYTDECYREAIYSAMNLLSHRELDLSGEERSALTGMVSRLVSKLGVSEEDMRESLSGQLLNVDALQEAAERLFIETLLEAGQRHRDEDYKIFDDILALLRRLRGQSPKELQAEREEHAKIEQDADPTFQVKSGYQSGQPAAALQESYQGVLEEDTLVILQESGDGDGLRWEISIIEAGKSKNKRRYRGEVLRQAAPLFEGCRVYVYDRLARGKELYDHLSEEELKANPRGYARDLCGFLSQPRFDGSRLMASLTILPSHAWLGKNVQAALRQGLPMPYGFSIDAEGDGHWVQDGSEQLLEVDAIKLVRSTDVVTYPAAGGKFLRLVASVALHEAEVQTLQVAEAIQHRVARRSFEVTLREILDDLPISLEQRRDTRRRILEALPEA